MSEQYQIRAQSSKGLAAVLCQTISLGWLFRQIIITLFINNSRSRPINYYCEMLYNTQTHALISSHLVQRPFFIGVVSVNSWCQKRYCSCWYSQSKPLSEWLYNESLLPQLIKELRFGATCGMCVSICLCVWRLCLWKRKVLFCCLIICLLSCVSSLSTSSSIGHTPLARKLHSFCSMMKRVRSNTPRSSEACRFYF